MGQHDKCFILDNFIDVWDTNQCVTDVLELTNLRLVNSDMKETENL